MLPAPGAPLQSMAARAHGLRQRVSLTLVVVTSMLLSVLSSSARAAAPDPSLTYPDWRPDVFSAVSDLAASPFQPAKHVRFQSLLLGEEQPLAGWPRVARIPRVGLTLFGSAADAFDLRNFRIATAPTKRPAFDALRFTFEDGTERPIYQFFGAERVNLHVPLLSSDQLVINAPDTKPTEAAVTWFELETPIVWAKGRIAGPLLSVDPNLVVELSYDCQAAVCESVTSGGPGLRVGVNEAKAQVPRESVMAVLAASAAGGGGGGGAGAGNADTIYPFADWRAVTRRDWVVTLHMEREQLFCAQVNHTAAGATFPNTLPGDHVTGACLRDFASTGVPKARCVVDSAGVRFSTFGQACERTTPIIDPSATPTASAPTATAPANSTAVAGGDGDAGVVVRPPPARGQDGLLDGVNTAGDGAGGVADGGDLDIGVVLAAVLGAFGFVCVVFFAVVIYRHNRTRQVMKMHPPPRSPSPMFQVYSNGLNASMNSARRVRPVAPLKVLDVTPAPGTTAQYGTGKGKQGSGARDAAYPALTAEERLTLQRVKSMGSTPLVSKEAAAAAAAHGVDLDTYTKRAAAARTRSTLPEVGYATVAGTQADEAYARVEDELGIREDFDSLDRSRVGSVLDVGVPEAPPPLTRLQRGKGKAGSKKGELNTVVRSQPSVDSFVAAQSGGGGFSSEEERGHASDDSLGREVDDIGSLYSGARSMNTSVSHARLSRRGSVVLIPQSPSHADLESQLNSVGSRTPSPRKGPRGDGGGGDGDSLFDTDDEEADRPTADDFDHTAIALAAAAASASASASVRSSAKLAASEDGYDNVGPAATELAVVAEEASSDDGAAHGYENMTPGAEQLRRVSDAMAGAPVVRRESELDRNAAAAVSALRDYDATLGDGSSRESSAALAKRAERRASVTSSGYENVGPGASQMRKLSALLGDDGTRGGEGTTAAVAATPPAAAADAAAANDKRASVTSEGYENMGPGASQLRKLSTLLGGQDDDSLAGTQGGASGAEKRGGSKKQKTPKKNSLSKKEAKRRKAEEAHISAVAAASAAADAAAAAAQAEAAAAEAMALRDDDELQRTSAEPAPPAVAVATQPSLEQGGAAAVPGADGGYMNVGAAASALRAVDAMAGIMAGEEEAARSPATKKKSTKEAKKKKKKTKTGTGTGTKSADGLAAAPSNASVRSVGSPAASARSQQAAAPADRQPAASPGRKRAGSREPPQKDLPSLPAEAFAEQLHGDEGATRNARPRPSQPTADLPAVPPEASASAAAASAAEGAEKKKVKKKQTRPPPPTDEPPAPPTGPVPKRLSEQASAAGPDGGRDRGAVEEDPGGPKADDGYMNVGPAASALRAMDAAASLALTPARSPTPSKKKKKGSAKKKGKQL